jgi:hypothetical protein
VPLPSSAEIEATGKDWQKISAAAKAAARPKVEQKAMALAPQG